MENPDFTLLFLAALTGNGFVPNETELEQLIVALRTVPLLPLDVAGFFTDQGASEKIRLLERMSASAEPIEVLRSAMPEAVSKDRLWLFFASESSFTTAAKERSITETVNYVVTVEKWIIRELRLKLLFILAGEFKVCTGIVEFCTGSRKHEAGWPRSSLPRSLQSALQGG